MGVSIQAYSKMRLTKKHQVNPDRCADHVQAFVLEGFDASLRGLMPGRCYIATNDTKRLQIMDTAYGSFNRWREQLCQMAHGIAPEVMWADPDKYVDHDFFEIIHFADNEGCIGPEAANDLLDDFIVWVDHLGQLPQYDRWLNGLRLAADGGLVEYT